MTTSSHLRKVYRKPRGSSHLRKAGNGENVRKWPCTCCVGTVAQSHLRKVCRKSRESSHLRKVGKREGGIAGEVADSVRLEKCIQRGEVFFGMGECGLEVLAVEFTEGDERGGGQGLEQAAGADGVFRGVDQQHGDGDVLRTEAGGEEGSCRQTHGFSVTAGIGCFAVIAAVAVTAASIVIVPVQNPDDLRRIGDETVHDAAPDERLPAGVLPQMLPDHDGAHGECQHVHRPVPEDGDMFQYRPKIPQILAVVEHVPVRREVLAPSETAVVEHPYVVA